MAADREDPEAAVLPTGVRSKEAVDAIDGLGTAREVAERVVAGVAPADAATLAELWGRAEAGGELTVP